MSNAKRGKGTGTDGIDGIGTRTVTLDSGTGTGSAGTVIGTCTFDIDGTD